MSKENNPDSDSHDSDVEDEENDYVQELVDKYANADKYANTEKERTIQRGTVKQHEHLAKAREKALAARRLKSQQRKEEELEKLRKQNEEMYAKSADGEDNKADQHKQPATTSTNIPARIRRKTPSVLKRAPKTLESKRSRRKPTVVEEMESSSVSSEEEHVVIKKKRKPKKKKVRVLYVEDTSSDDGGERVHYSRKPKQSISSQVKLEATPIKPSFLDDII